MEFTPAYFGRSDFCAVSFGKADSVILTLDRIRALKCCLSPGHRMCQKPSHRIPGFLVLVAQWSVPVSAAVRAASWVQASLVNLVFCTRVQGGIRISLFLMSFGHQFWWKKDPVVIKPQVRLFCFQLVWRLLWTAFFPDWLSLWGKMPGLKLNVEVSLLQCSICHLSWTPH